MKSLEVATETIIKWLLNTTNNLRRLGHISFVTMYSICLLKPNFNLKHILPIN